MFQEDHHTFEHFEPWARNGDSLAYIFGVHKTRREIKRSYVKRQAKTMNKAQPECSPLINPNQARNNKGLTSIIDKQSLPPPLRTTNDPSHRYIISHHQVTNNLVLVIVNVYGPNDKQKNDLFFSQLTETIKAEMSKNRENEFDTALIVAGDMNAKIDQYDTKFNKDNQTFEGLRYLIEELNLQDTYRLCNPNNPNWTWMKRNYKKDPSEYQQTRIDHILVSNHFQLLSSKIHDYSVLLSSDHKPISTKLKLNLVTSPPIQTPETKPIHRTKLKTRNLTSEEIRKQLKEVEFEHLDELEEILNNINLKSERTTIQAQVNSFYSTFTKSIQTECTQVFGLTQEPQNRDIKDPIENHKGIMRIMETIDKLKRLTELYHGNFIPSQEKMKKLCQKITMTSKNKIFLNITTTVNSKNNRRIRRATVHANNLLNRKLRNIKRKKIQTYIENLRNSQENNPQKFFSNAKDHSQKPLIPSHFTTYHDPNKTIQPPSTLNEAIESNSDINKEKGWTPVSHVKIEDKLKVCSQFWQAIFNEKVAKTKRNGQPYLPYTEENLCPPLKYQISEQVSLGDIHIIIQESKNHVSPNSDEKIGNEIWKNLPAKAYNLLLHFLKICWDIAVIPTSWKISQLVLIPKTGNLGLWCNYRPIAILSCAYKFFTKIILNKLTEHFHKNDLIDPLQFGSKKDASITQALLTYASVIEDAKRHNKKLYLISLDLSKAYDTVTFFLLKRTLKYYRVPTFLIQLIEYLYEDTQAELFTPIGKTDENIRFKSGVRQGCGLSPLLWIIFINPILEKLRKSKLGYKMANNLEIIIPHITFVDDITLIADSIEEAKLLLKIVEECMAELGLRINEKKSALIIKEHLENNTEEETLTINATKIQTVTGNKSFRLLGVNFNTELSWEDQFNILKKQMIHNTYRLNMKYYTTKQKITLCNMLFTPAIAYRLNVVTFSSTQCKYLDSLLAKVVTNSANLAPNHAHVKLWDKPTNGGAGLSSIAHMNKITFTANIINYGLNSPNPYPKICLEQMAIDQGIKLSNITKNFPLQDDDSLLHNLIRNLKAVNLNLIKSPSPKLPLFNLDPTNLPRQQQIYDKQNKEWFLPIFTDGSYNPKTKNTTCTVIIGKLMQHKYTWEAKLPGSSFNAELESLEFAIHKVHPELQSIIFSNCQPAIEVIGRPLSKYSEIYKDPARSFRTRINNTLQELQNKNIPIPTIVKVYSHIKEKMSNTESKESLKTNIESSLKELERRFGKKNTATIIKGNILADELVSKKASCERQNNNITIPAGTPSYNIANQTHIIEGNVAHILKGIHSTTIHNDRKKTSKKVNQNFDSFDFNISNIHLTSNNPQHDSLFNHTLRIRNNALHLPARCSPNRSKNIQTETQDLDFNKLKNQITYPDPRCELCNSNEICSYHHLWTCTALKKEQDLINKKTGEILKEITGSKPFPYYWCTETRNLYQPCFPARQPPAILECVCQLPTHGQYITCQDCDKNFHPECIGVSTDLDELTNRKKSFQCNECNPRRSYFFRKHRDWIPGLKGKNQTQNRQQNKKKISQEVLITHALKLTSPTNRRKLQLARSQQNKIDVATKLELDLNKNPAIAALRRANLVYIPKCLKKSCLLSAKSLGLPKDQAKSKLSEVNRTIIEGGYELYKRWLCLNRDLRKSENTNWKALYTPNKTNKSYFKNISEWTNPSTGTQTIPLTGIT